MYCTLSLTGYGKQIFSHFGGNKTTKIKEYELTSKIRNDIIFVVRRPLSLGIAI
jgi:hypothetical protein